jgi:hypothetical protein
VPIHKGVSANYHSPLRWRQPKPPNPRKLGVGDNGARKPVLRLEVGFVKLGFRGARFRLVAILPTHEGRQRHQNRFCATVGLESKNCASVIDQIELYIAAPSIELEIALLLSVFLIATLLGNGDIGGQKPVSTGLDKGK